MLENKSTSAHLLRLLLVRLRLNIETILYPGTEFPEMDDRDREDVLRCVPLSDQWIVTKADTRQQDVEKKKHLDQVYEFKQKGQVKTKAEEEKLFGNMEKTTRDGRLVHIPKFIKQHQDQEKKTHIEGRAKRKW